MKKLFDAGFIAIAVIVVVSLFIFALSDESSTTNIAGQAGGNSDLTRGMYVNQFDSILGDSAKEDRLLQFAENNGITYLALYNLHQLWDKSSELSSFIIKAKRYYGIEQVGAIGENMNFFNKVIEFNNIGVYEERKISYRGGARGKFDVLNLELEYWNGAVSFNEYMSRLNGMTQLAHRNGLVAETYVGWFQDDEADQIASTVDRLLIHAYKSNPNSAYPYMQNRIMWLANTNENLEIWPIFSAEDQFMGKYLRFLPSRMISAENIVRDAYYSDTTVDKKNLQLTGFQYFAYTYLKGDRIKKDFVTY